MAYDYSDVLKRSQQWAEQAHSTGWITAQQHNALHELQARTPELLFGNTASRPLIVAFMGGTGVGKSSLINRLAGDDVARTGVERPTSREVTLYYHQSVQLENLPDSLPLDKIKLAQHDNAARKQVMWVDMPDMDSVEKNNQQLVLEWLPHIDVLVYVVSPERYRDNKAWRLLLAESARHAWVFVLNQWDRGQEEQYVDFCRQLEKAGFTDPIIKRTISEPGLYTEQEDEFEQLQDIINQLGDNNNTIEHLETRGDQLRKQELQQKLLTLQHQLGQDNHAYVAIQKQWNVLWSQTEQVLVQGFEWPLQQLAVQYVQSSAHLLENKDSAKQGSEKYNIWDDWAQSRLEDALDEVVLYADQQQLPITPLRNDFIPLKAQAGKYVMNQIELAVRRALANPGNTMQRFFLKLSAVCAAVLPLLAMSWVGFQIYEGYYDSALTDEAYLGSNFAIHSVLLISISWLMPFFIQKQFQPSLEKVALHGLQKGLQTGLAVLDEQAVSIIRQNQQQRSELNDGLAELITQCQQQAAVLTEDSNLSRMLVD